MARTTHRAPLILKLDEREQLVTLSQSRTAPKRETERAKILLRYAEGKTIQAIHQELGLSRPTIYKCLDKALAAGVAVGLQDKFHRPKAPEITEEYMVRVRSQAPLERVPFLYRGGKILNKPSGLG
ncbi:MAG: helix-turn-helix domain-containing protein [Nitrospirae bacterium]|nr:helix-turn-helix domain-containing protein [Nitrospirota bacterium]